MKRLNRISASRYDNVPGYEAPEGGYLYIFKHGIGPGTMPSDVHIVKVKDLPNYYTAVWLDSFLTTDEMKRYDIPFESDIKYYLDRIGYCLKDGDVVPCDEVEACDVTASSDVDADLPTFREFATTEWELLNDGSKRLKLKDLFVYFGTDKQWNASNPGYWYEIRIGDKTYKESKKYSINNKERCYKAMQRAVSELLQSDNIESCDKVTASEDFENDEDEIYWVQAYSSKPHRGLADDSSTNDWDAAIEKLVEFANDGYYVMFENLASGEGYEYDPDEVLEAVDFGDIYTLRGLESLYEG